MSCTYFGTITINNAVVVVLSNTFRLGTQAVIVSSPSLQQSPQRIMVMSMKSPSSQIIAVVPIPCLMHKSRGADSLISHILFILLSRIVLYFKLALLVSLTGFRNLIKGTVYLVACGSHNCLVYTVLLKRK